MTGNDTAGFHPDNVLIAQGGCFRIQHGTDGFLHIGGVDEVDVLLVECVLFGEFPQQLGSQLGHGTPVLLTGNELSVNDLNAGMQIQQIAHQSYRVAAAATGSQVVQILGDKAHSGFQTDFHSLGSSLLQSGLGMLTEPFGSGQHHGTLAHRNMLGVHQTDVVCVGLFFQRQLTAVVGAGGDGGVGQIQNLCIGIFCEDLFQDLLKIIGSAAAGGGSLAGTLVVCVDIFGREGTIIQGYIAHGNMHGHQTDIGRSGQFGSDIRAGFGQQNNRRHRNSFQKVRKFFVSVFEKPIQNNIPVFCKKVKNY